MSLKDVVPTEGRPAPVVKRRRRRGGQPGNINALKHGVYSGVVTDDERKQVGDYTIESGLLDEVRMAIVLFRRACAAYDEGRCGPELVSQALKDVVRIKAKHIDIMNSNVVDSATALDRARAIADALESIQEQDETDYQPVAADS